MLNTFRFEAGNMLALRSRQIFAVVGGLVLLLAALITAFVPGLDQGNLSAAILEAAVSVAGVYIPIMVILIFAGDWKSGVTHYTLLHFQNRKQVWVAKAVLSLTLALAATLVCLMLSFGLAAITGGLSSASDQPWAYVLGVVPVFLYTALGMGLASVLLSPWAAILAFIVVTSIMDGLLGLLPGELASWIQFSASVQNFTGSGALSLAGSTALVLWIVPLSALGFRRYQRADIG
ncbi:MULTISPECIES: hypothetical protein [Micrococcaceae]|uniref:hypothetical protein n=1 Tax=Micrococcaceae TaxID=1268 RepID=UPI00047ACB14|nr:MULTISPECIES: hypothetical protein [Micrococcaceae]BCW56803.1 hypothetical protein StoSoilB20_01500 [Arthrobacter sp. StoSoilB20]